MKKIFCIAMCLLLLSCNAYAVETGQVGQRHVIATTYYIDGGGTVRSWRGEAVELPSRAIDISSGVYGAASNSVHNMAAVLEDGSLYVWGYNGGGCLISGLPEEIEIPTRVEGIEGVLSVSLGDGNGFIALTDGGNVYCMDSTYKKPALISQLKNITAVCRGGGYAAITADGELYTWGDDTGFSNGYGSEQKNNSPAPVKLDLPPVRAVARNTRMGLAVTVDGELYTWGSNDNGQLGRAENMPYDSRPQKVGIGNVTTAAAGRFYYAGAACSDGSLFQWGSTARDAKEHITGETDSISPIKIAGGLDIVQMVLGAGQSGCLTGDGGLYVWGWNAGGELGIGGEQSYYVTYPTLIKAGAANPSGLPFEGDINNLRIKQKTYENQFADVPSGEWYGDIIADAFELGMVNGVSEDAFEPNGHLRLSEAVKLAVMTYERYTGNSEAIANGSPWYQPYLHRAATYGICEIGEFEDLDAYATRAQMAAVFARALPKSEMAHRSDKLPADVDANHKYYEEITALYKMGALQGINEAGDFEPDAYITRAEATAICLRLATGDEAES